MLEGFLRGVALGAVVFAVVSVVFYFDFFHRR